MGTDAEVIKSAMVNFLPKENLQLIAAVNFVLTSKMDEIKNELKNHDDKITKNEMAIDSMCKQLEKVYFVGLDREVHDRKWSVIVDGIPGKANEPSFATRKKIKSLGDEVFDTPGCSLKACHRLMPKDNARIIVVFTDLDIRNKWFENAKNLKEYNRKQGVNVYISPDLPPAVRPLRNDVLFQRKQLRDDSPGKIVILKYKSEFPYVYLKIKDGPTMMPKLTRTEIMEKAIGIF